MTCLTRLALLTALTGLLAGCSPKPLTNAADPNNPPPKPGAPSGPPAPPPK